jgi:hypothetical protein
MRSLFSTFLLALFALSTASCTATPVFPTGVFLREGSGDVITIQDNGVFTASDEDGAIFLSGTYAINGYFLVVSSSNEKMCESKLPETYTWTFRRNILSVRTTSEDACLLRGDIYLIKQ